MINTFVRTVDKQNEFLKTTIVHDFYRSEYVRIWLKKKDHIVFDFRYIVGL